jgi:hypothetical protein
MLRISGKSGQQSCLVERTSKESGAKYSRIFRLETPGDSLLVNCLQNDVVKELQKNGLLVDFNLSPPPNEDMGLLVASIETVPFSTSSWTDWPSTDGQRLSYRTMLECAQLWLEINRRLAKEGLCLVDAHLANFAFDSRMRPVWIDLDSIARIHHGAEGLVEFRRTFTRPLISLRRYPVLSRSLRSAIGTMTSSELRALTKIPSLSFRGIEISSGLPIYLSRFLGTKVPLAKSLRLFLMSLNSFLLPKSSNAPRSYWAHYVRKNPFDQKPTDEREKELVDTISKLQFDSVADIGGNDGRYLWMLKGRASLAALFDLEDSALAIFLKHLSNLPGDSGDEAATNVNYFALLAGADAIPGKYDLVLGLALTHHLVLSQHWSFERVAVTFREKTKKHLLVEYMPNGVGLLQMTYPEIPAWYTLENFVATLSMQFKTVRVVTKNHEAPRVLIHCEV